MRSSVAFSMWYSAHSVYSLGLKPSSEKVWPTSLTDPYDAPTPQTWERAGAASATTPRTASSSDLFQVSNGTSEDFHVAVPSPAHSNGSGPGGEADTIPPLPGLRRPTRKRFTRSR